MRIKEFIGPISTVAAALIISAGAYVTLNQFVPTPPPKPHEIQPVTVTYNPSDYYLAGRADHDYALENLQKKYDICEAKLPEKDREKPANYGTMYSTTPTYTTMPVN